MRRLVFVVALALVVSACGADPVAPTPPPLPTANIMPSAQASWVSCLSPIGGFVGSCQLQGEARNVGQGCASAVRGVTRFRNAGGAQIGPTAAWSLSSTRIVRPNEAFVYLTSSIDLPTVNQVASYVTEPSWTTVSCQ